MTTPASRAAVAAATILDCWDEWDAEAGLIAQRDQSDLTYQGEMMNRLQEVIEHAIKAAIADERSRRTGTPHVFKPDPWSSNQEKCLVCGHNIRDESHIRWE